MTTANRDRTADSCLYTLPSIIERLDLGSLFRTPQPLEVELGCGDASFLVEHALAHPGRNFLGVERLLGRLKKLDRKARQLQLSNVRGIQIEAAYFLEYLLPRRSVQALHVYFPDPWPKLRHHRRRLINPRFPDLALQALVPGGMVYFRTDDRSYFEQVVEVFRAATTFVQRDTPADIAGRRTDFELEFLRQGRQTFALAYQCPSW